VRVESGDIIGDPTGSGSLDEARPWMCRSFVT
jgi:hypothetical protein